MTNSKPKITFTAGFSAYLLAQRARNLTTNYTSILERTRDCFLKRFGDLALDDLQAEHARTYLLWLAGKDKAEDAPVAPRNQRGQALSGATVCIHYRNLKAFCRWLEDEELIGRSPMRKVKAPRSDEKLPEALTEAEVHVLLNQVRENGDRHAWRDYCIHLMFLDTGIRLQELAALNVGDLNFESGYAKVFGKGRRERIVPLGVELRRDLNRYLLKYREVAEGEMALFVNEHGQRFDRGGIRTMVVRDLRRYVPRTLAKCGPHTERHTSATLRLRKTHDLKITSMVLGHSTTRTTERYVHLTGADVLRDAAGSAMDDVMRGAKK